MPWWCKRLGAGPGKKHIASVFVRSVWVVRFEWRDRKPGGPARPCPAPSRHRDAQPPRGNAAAAPAGPGPGPPPVWWPCLAQRPPRPGPGPGSPRGLALQPWSQPPTAPPPPAGGRNRTHPFPQPGSPVRHPVGGGAESPSRPWSAGHLRHSPEAALTRPAAGRRHLPLASSRGRPPPEAPAHPRRASRGCCSRRGAPAAPVLSARLALAAYPERVAHSLCTWLAWLYVIIR